MLSQILFSLFLLAGSYFFARKVREISRNIKLGRDLQINDRPADRWKVMARVALGQSKMTSRPVAAFFHLLIYVGFVIINIEVIEIIID